MKTILKWPGGKENELQIIRNNIPKYSGRYIEPFVGGGAVFFDTDNTNCYINDKSFELINLYNCAKNKDDDFISFIQKLYDEFSSISTFVDKNHPDILLLYHSQLSINDFINKHDVFFSSLAKLKIDVFFKELVKNLAGKIIRSQKLEKEHGEIPDNDRICNIESALKSAYYMYVRYLLNHTESLSIGKQSAVFYFIREYCYSSMFRYNKKGEFNVPYGGISYNRKDFQKKIDYLLSDEMHAKLNTATICCEDFEVFINNLNLSEDDFIFLDPPYDSDFSTYAQNAFGPDEQVRLCECLKKTKAKIMLVIKNTELIYNLYKTDFNILSFDKTYLVSFKNRNDRSVKHLVITNY